MHADYTGQGVDQLAKVFAPLSPCPPSSHFPQFPIAVLKCMFPPGHRYHQEQPQRPAHPPQRLESGGPRCSLRPAAGRPARAATRARRSARGGERAHRKRACVQGHGWSGRWRRRAPAERALSRAAGIMALPPCHMFCQFYVDTDKGELSCQMYQVWVPPRHARAPLARAAAAPERASRFLLWRWCSLRRVGCSAPATSGSASLSTSRRTPF